MEQGKAAIVYLHGDHSLQVVETSWVSFM